MMSRLFLSCVVFFCLMRELFAQQTSTQQDLPELPTSMSLTTPRVIPFPKHTPEMVEKFLAQGKSYGLAEDIGDIILMPADLVFDALFIGLHSLGKPDQNTITSRVMSVEVTGDNHLFAEFMTHLYERERKFLGGFTGSYLSNPGVEDGTATIDIDDFKAEQKKVMWDVLKKTYFSKYRFQAEERINEDGFYINKWHGVDFVALPPFLAGYLYYRGLDKSFTIGDFKFRALIEPAQRLLTGDVVGAAMIDIRPTNWPVGIIGSVGLYNNKLEFEFIGIGTTIDAVKKAIKLAQND